ncbi:hypothetical protein B0H19DRAFT_1258342 [Mycena capillaripes]|nr:hypothetical protein B0H19DRAFT_1258342 [Mycena capillaripes]
MESGPTDELLAIIGNFKLFFVLKMILLEWYSCRSSARKELSEVGWVVGAEGHRMMQKYRGSAERVHKGLVDVFDKKGWYVLQPLSCSLSLP